MSAEDEKITLTGNKLEETRRAMRNITDEIEARLPNDWGFFVLITPFKEGGRANYSSNMERQGALNTMREFIIRNVGTEEEWMKEIFDSTKQKGV